MRGTGRAIAGAVAIIAFSAPAVAGAATYSTGFDSDDAGWQILQIADPESVTLEPDYSPTDGNPGGFIRYTDEESGVGDLEAYFSSPFLLDPTDVGGVLSFDLRSNATALRAAGAGVIVFAEDESVSCQLGAPPNTAWNTYAVTYDAHEPCWLDIDNNDADGSELEAAIDEGGASFLLFADMGTSSAELTDLDNLTWIGGPAVTDRELSIAYKKRTKSFSGRVTSGEAACVDGEAVELYLERSGTDRRLAIDGTSGTGKWKVARKAKEGKRYYAVALPSAAGEVGCREVLSKTIKG